MAVRIGGAFSSAFGIFFSAIWLGLAIQIPAPMNALFVLVGLFVMAVSIRNLVRCVRGNRGMAQEARRLTDEASRPTGAPGHRFCPYCGTELKPDYTHCPACGTRVEP